MLSPLADRILIKPDTPSDVTESGIKMIRDYVPENMGTVVALPSHCTALCPDCGTKVVKEPSVKVGDTVLFGYDAGQEITIDASRYLLIRDTDLIAVLSTEEEVTHG